MKHKDFFQKLKKDVDLNYDEFFGHARDHLNHDDPAEMIKRGRSASSNSEQSQIISEDKDILKKLVFRAISKNMKVFSEWYNEKTNGTRIKISMSLEKLKDYNFSTFSLETDKNGIHVLPVNCLTLVFAEENGYQKRNKMFQLHFRIITIYPEFKEDPNEIIISRH